jgi:hypothetical protein
MQTQLYLWHKLLHHGCVSVNYYSSFGLSNLRHMTMTGCRRLWICSRKVYSKQGNVPGNPSLLQLSSGKEKSGRIGAKRLVYCVRELTCSSVVRRPVTALELRPYSSDLWPPKMFLIPRQKCVLKWKWFAIAIVECNPCKSDESSDRSSEICKIWGFYYGDMKNGAFWYVTPCDSSKIRPFRRT